MPRLYLLLAVVAILILIATALSLGYLTTNLFTGGIQ